LVLAASPGMDRDEGGPKRRSREDQDAGREREALERRSREDQDAGREREALERRSREDQDAGREREALEQLKAHLLALSVSLPELIERVRAQAEAQGNTTIPAALIDAQAEGQRLTAFAAYLDHYSRIDGRTLGPLDVRDILEQAVALARGEIEPKARFRASYLPAPLVRASTRQLGQVFVSLLINAAPALPAGRAA